MKKYFTLIELIVVIVIIGILAVIVIPNISSQQKDATKSAIVSNVRNLQTSTDMFALKNNGSIPTKNQPSLGFPEPVDFEQIKPKYTRTIPKTEGVKYWIDYQGKVWASTVDSPKDLAQSGLKLDWTEVKGAKEYNVYEIVTNATSSIANSSETLKYANTVTNSEFEVNSSTKEYAVSSVDEEGFESPPAKVGYSGYQEPTAEKGSEEEVVVPTPPVPVNHVPIAEITVTPETKILTTTTLTYSHLKSTDQDGDTIQNAEWKFNGNPVTRPPSVISTAGVHVVSLRVQDSQGLWSDWVEKKVYVFGQINAVGSTNGNAINSYGYYTYQEDWIYFSDEATRKLYKVKKDGTQKTLILNETVGNVNVIGEWVYFTKSGGIHKIKVDGSDLTLISNDKVYRSMIVAGEWVYFVNYNDSNRIYKVKTDGTGRMKLNDDTSWFMNYSNGVLYYENMSDNRYIYKVNIDGTGRSLVKAISVQELNVTDNYIYFSAPTLQRINKDGSGHVTLNNNITFTIHVDSNYIYYKNNSDAGNVYRAPLTGGTGIKVTTVSDIDALHVAYNWVLYKYGSSYYKVRNDGAYLTKLN